MRRDVGRPGVSVDVTDRPQMEQLLAMCPRPRARGVAAEPLKLQFPANMSHRVERDAAGVAFGGAH